MFDQTIVRHLEKADEFEWTARRLFEAKTRPLNWVNTYIQCLSDASRERAAARKLVLYALKDSYANERSAQGGEASKWPDEIRRITLEQLLQLAATVRSAPVRSQRIRRAAVQMSQVAALLQNSRAMAHLLWWCAEIEPVPPGKPVIEPYVPGVRS